MFSSFTGSFQFGRRQPSGRTSAQIYLDAANPASYSWPASGTTWTDISGNGNNATLVNGTAYGSGSMYFDGDNDYVDIYTPNLGSTATIEMWVNLGAAYAGKMFFGWNSYDIYTGNGHLGYNTATGDVYGISSTQVTNLGLVGNWKHYIFEMRSDVSYTNNKIYINGVQQSLSQLGGVEDPANRNFNSGYGRIGVWRYNGNYNMPMRCSVFIVYNRSLTATEIAQNYAAFQRRYGA